MTERLGDQGSSIVLKGLDTHISGLILSREEVWLHNPVKRTTCLAGVASKNQAVDALQSRLKRIWT